MTEYNRHNYNSSGRKCNRACHGSAYDAHSRAGDCYTTSALDERNRQAVLSLLNRIRQKTKVAYLLITHDMNVVRQMADDVLVLKEGKCVEVNDVHRIFAHPKNEYTKKLLEASLLN